MTWTRKEIVLKVVVPFTTALAGAAVSGWLVWRLDPNWDLRAKENGWIPASRCPGVPLSLSISGPGDGSIVPFYSSTQLSTPIIISANRPIADHEAIALIESYDGSDQIYVTFPTPEFDDGRTTVRLGAGIYGGVWLQGLMETAGAATLRIAAVTNKKAIGEYYSNIDQLQSLPAVATVSKPIRIVRK